MIQKKKDFIERTLRAENYSGPTTGFSRCAKCGECCMLNSCSCVPDDFNNLTVNGIEALLDSGKYMITASYEPKRLQGIVPVEAIPHISAREIGAPQNGINITMVHHKCAMLGKSGCSLTEDERPVQGLLLIPWKDGKCKCFVDTPTNFWVPYKAMLDSVVLKRTGKTTQQLFEDEVSPLAKELKQKVMRAVVYNEPITLGEQMAAEAMVSLGIFYWIFGWQIGQVMDDFVYMVSTKPLK